MNWGEALQMLREDILNDAIQEYFWSDAQLLRMYNRAINEACERAALLTASKTYTIPSAITLPAEAINITDMYLDSTKEPITQLSEVDIYNRFGSTWRIDEGVPRYFIRQNKTITIYPIPQNSDSITIFYTRRPKLSESVESNCDSPPIDAQYHYPLLYWVANLAYGKRDADSYNPDKALEYSAKFDNAFGARHSANWDRFAQDMPANACVNARAFVAGSRIIIK